MRIVTRTAMFAFIGVCLGMIVWFGILKPVSGASQEKPKRPLLSKLPPIKNCTEHVKLLNAELVMWGDSQVASLEVQNEAYVGIVAISLEQTANKQKQSIEKNGFRPDGPPLVVIAPGERKKLTIGNLGDKSPIRIGGVIFSDGEEEGCGSSLKSLHQSRAYYTKKGADQK
jgi:hypothetical protein